uniref:Chromosome 11 open reading frame 52 n=1 Tax=Loxodonta africana TaxID=9785 RepID=G3T447_LOXAF
MGNQLCCGRSWSCPSTLQRKKKTGNSEPLDYASILQSDSVGQNGTKGPQTPGHTYERVLEQPEPRQRHQGFTSEDSSVHYADIRVCSQSQSRSAGEVKHLQLENATEYATLRFPQATPRYDNKNGTLV